MSNLPNTSPAPQPFGPQPNADPPEPVQQVGVPRRFGVGTLLVITAMYAVLFAVLRALSWPPIVFVIVTLFFTAVGLGQMLLFKGKQPRTASVLVGACLLPCIGIGGLMFLEFGMGLGRVPLGTRLANCACVLVAGIMVGWILGYLAGLTIAGVFLVFVRWGSRCKKPQGRG